jgi:hypothetical protein
MNYLTAAGQCLKTFVHGKSMSHLHLTCTRYLGIEYAYNVESIFEIG